MGPKWIVIRYLLNLKGNVYTLCKLNLTIYAELR